VAAGSVTDDLVVIVAGEVVEGGLGPAMLVVPTPDFRRLALRTTARGLPAYSMSFSMNPDSASRWKPWLVKSDRLAERFGVKAGLAPAAISTGDEDRAAGRALGSLGEAEVVLRLAQDDRLNVFRPFPDSETVELAVRHLKNGNVVGLQIKTVSVDAVYPNRPVDIHMSSFRPAPTTYFTVVAWVPDQHAFHDECLVIPSEELLDFARPDGSHYKFEFQPGSRKQARLDRYRRSISDLCVEVEDLL
jgi:hypothetical protein